MNYVKIDHGLHPIVMVSINPVNSTNSQFNQCLHELTAAVNEVRRGVLIFKFSSTRLLGSDRLVEIQKWIREHDKAVKTNMIGLCYVNKSLLALLVLKSILILRKPPVPYSITRSEGKAIDWAFDIIYKPLAKS